MSCFKPIRIDKTDFDKNETVIDRKKVQINFDLLARCINELELSIGGGSGGGGVGPSPVPDTPGEMSAYDLVGDDPIGLSDSDITFDTNVRVDPEFTHVAGSAETTINKSAYYTLNADSGFNLVEGDSVEMSFFRDEGGGYVEIPGTQANVSA